MAMTSVIQIWYDAQITTIKYMNDLEDQWFINYTGKN